MSKDKCRMTRKRIEKYQTAKHRHAKREVRR